MAAFFSALALLSSPALAAGGYPDIPIGSPVTVVLGTGSSLPAGTTLTGVLTEEDSGGLGMVAGNAHYRVRWEHLRSVNGMPVGVSAEQAEMVAGERGIPMGVQSILAVDNSISMSYQLSRMSYGEPSNGDSVAGVGGISYPTKYLDTEYGYLRGGKTALSYMGYLYGIHDLYANLSYRYVYGRTAYNGYECVANCSGVGSPEYQPYLGSTGATISDTIFKLGKGFEGEGSLVDTPYLIGGYHYWVRNLYGSIVESYENGFIGAGDMLQYSPLDRLVVTLDGSASGMIRPMMRASDMSSSFHLGSQPVVMAAAEVDYRFWGSMHVFAGFDYSHFSYEPQSQTLAGFLEPISTTDLAYWSFGIRQSF